MFVIGERVVFGVYLADGAVLACEHPEGDGLRDARGAVRQMHAVPHSR